MTRTEYATATIPFHMYGSAIVVYTFKYDEAARETVNQIKKDLSLIHRETAMYGFYIGNRPAFAREVREAEAQEVKSVDQVNELSASVVLASEEFFGQSTVKHREYDKRAEKAYKDLTALFKKFCQLEQAE